MRNAALSIALVCLAAACGSDKTDAVSNKEAAKLLEDRNWIDHWPQNAEEKLWVYRFTPAMGGGVFQDRTLFKGVFELFTYEIGDGEIRINWHHTSEKERVTFQIRRVDGPKPFDLRLDLKGSSRGPKVYFGRSSETHADPLVPHIQSH